ncbi:glycosyltransferase family 1 protein [Schinkia sp. CFF1]
MVRVLHIVTALDGGGVERMLFNYYSNMDRENFKFDFITHGENGFLEKQFKDLGSEIFHIPSLRKSPIKNLALTKKIISYGNYDIVHSHIGASSALPIYFSKKAKINMRITHNHLAYRKESFHRKIIIKILTTLLKKHSTNWLACGQDAAISFWGERAVKKGKAQVINNAINVERFIFNKDVREKIRRELDLEGKFVVGNVARFDFQKNHEFLIRIFSELYKVNKNSILILIGNGDLEEEIKKQVDNLGLTNVVKFLGVRKDVSDLLNAMDIFLLPSKFEGLPVVLVEAQASGLKCITSDTITREVDVTDLIKYISLDNSAENWANEIMEFKRGYIRRDTSEEIKKAGYDIKQEAKKMESFYEQYES